MVGHDLGVLVVFTHVWAADGRTRTERNNDGFQGGSVVVNTLLVPVKARWF